jgi:hypothetical protein
MTNINDKFKVRFGGWPRRGAPSDRDGKAEEFFVWIPGNPWENAE